MLVVDGFGGGRSSTLAERAAQVLAAAGNTVERVDLAAAGFDAFMSAAERAAYLTDEPLVTPETRAAADQVRRAEGMVVAYPVVHATAPPRVKSWQERVFVLGVGFEFQPSGVITGALSGLRRALVVGVDPALPATSAAERWPRPVGARRNDFGPCFARMFHLSSNRSCRAHYAAVASEDDGTSLLERELAAWS